MNNFWNLSSLHFIKSRQYYVYLQHFSVYEGRRSKDSIIVLIAEVLGDFLERLTFVHSFHKAFKFV